MPRETTQIASRANDIIRRRMALLLQTLGMELDIAVESGEIQKTLNALSPNKIEKMTESISVRLSQVARGVRIQLTAVDLSPAEATTLLADGFILVAIDPRDTNSSWWIVKDPSGRNVSAIEISEEFTPRSLPSKKLSMLLDQDPALAWFIAQPMLMNNSNSSEQNLSNRSIEHRDSMHSIAVRDGDHAESSDASHRSPFQRIASLMWRDSQDFFSIGIFCFVSVVLGLATPLTVEVLVNTIGFGRSFQPIIVLSLVLLSVLVLSSAFKLLQVIVIELMQRRFFVRCVGDLAHRLPNVKRSAIQGIHGPELVNRFFDIMTIQKSIASLMLDGTTIVMQTLIGTLLLAFYHPYLLGFDIVLVLCMTLVTYLLGRNGARTAIQESIVKYSIAHWLQDAIACPTAFKLHGGGELCVDRANRLTVEYLTARRRHFFVLIRQIVFALLMLPLALTSLYALGGYLVVNNQLTLGQLVAAELVVAVIVGAFAKSGKLIETFYDLMAATDKVFHLLDLPIDPLPMPVDHERLPAAIRVVDLHVRDQATDRVIEVGSLVAEPGNRIAIASSVGAVDSVILPVIGGLLECEHGYIEIEGQDIREATRYNDSSLIGYAGPTEIFSGTIEENIRLGRLSITDNELKNALEIVELWHEILSFERGLSTPLQTGGFPLCENQLPRIMLARAIVACPRVLLVDRLLDDLPCDLRYRIWDRLRAAGMPWTLLISTHDQRIIKESDKEFRIAESRKA